MPHRDGTEGKTLTEIRDRDCLGMLVPKVGLGLEKGQVDLIGTGIDIEFVLEKDGFIRVSRLGIIAVKVACRVVGPREKASLRDGRARKESTEHW